MSSEVKLGAKAWLFGNSFAEIPALGRDLSGKLVGALHTAGGSEVYVYVLNPPTDGAVDTLYISVSMEKTGPVMSRLANYHPDETELLSNDTPGWNTIRAWWD